MDITEALAPNSDQLDAVELVMPRTFTIDTGSRMGQREGRAVAEIRLVGFDRVWRPSKGMLDVLARCWGTDAKKWVGRSVTLYNDPNVMFGKEKTGGTRISHLSHIDGPQSVMIRASGAGRKKLWKVEPLPDAPQQTPTPPTDNLAAVVAGLAQIGITERADMLAYCAKAVGHELTSARDLTPDEQTTVLDRIEADLSGQEGDQ